jgi:polyphenol oxidase
MNVLDFPGGAHVLFSARVQGNLSSTSGDDRERAAAAREELRTALGVERVLRCRQVHGSRVLREPATGPITPSESAELVEADGCATAIPGAAAMVLVADCLPVALLAPGAVAMVHAGWRGLAAGVIEQGIRALEEVGGGEAAGGGAPLAAAIGPGAGVCCYEVGEEVHAAFGGAHRHGDNLDLRALARDRLTAAGIADVREQAVCTICDERLFSHRREGVRSGRQAGLAWFN